MATPTMWKTEKKPRAVKVRDKELVFETGVMPWFKLSTDVARGNRRLKVRCYACDTWLEMHRTPALRNKAEDVRAIRMQKHVECSPFCGLYRMRFFCSGCPIEHFPRNECCVCTEAADQGAESAVQITGARPRINITTVLTACSMACATEFGSIRSGCARCHRIGKTLSACAGCRASFYCSTKCQREDWTHGHKALCKGYALLNKTKLDRPVGERTMNVDARVSGGVTWLF